MSLSPEPHLVSGGLTPEHPTDVLQSHAAAANNDVDKLSDLIEKGEPLVDPTTKETLLHAAARAGAKDTLEYILNTKLVSPTVMSTNGYTAAHFAALYKQLDALKLVLTHDHGLSNQLAHQLDESGLSLLSLATLEGSKEMVAWLLDNFPDLANIANQNGNLAVHFAAARGEMEILKLLIKKCGEEMAEKQDIKQTKPVYFASQAGRVKIIDYLINDLGVDPVARDKSGISTIHIATQGGHYNTVKWLVNKVGLNYILDKTIDGATPLHMAAAQGQTEILRFFLDSLENDSDVDVQDHIHATPAHDAAEYGETQSMLLLLRYGADVNIKDTENKTPYELAIEQNHSDVASMIADYRDGGISVLAKYEKKRRPRAQGREKSKNLQGPRTSMQESAELSSVIKHTAGFIDKRNEQTLQRQESLQKMNEVGTGSGDDKPALSPAEKVKGGRHKHKGVKPDDDDDSIEHTLGPLGDLYARPSKKVGRSKTGSRHNSDIEDFIEETMSHRSYSSNQKGLKPYHLPGLDDAPYASINHETASNYSRPSRVKRYQDSDSEMSSFAGSASYYYGRQQGSQGPYPYGPMYPPPLPPPRGSKRPGSVASSRHSSQGSQFSNPMPYGAMPPYGFNPNMMAAYYGYPAYPGGYPPAHTTQDRMQYEMMHQHGQAPMMPMYGHPPGLYVQRHKLHHKQKAGRRTSLLERKKKKGQAPIYDASAEHSGIQTPRKHTDQDMGYGPSLNNAKEAHNGTNSFHPVAPPVTKRDGTIEDPNEVVTFDNNFIMAKKKEDGTVRHLGATTLNPAAQGQKPYDGRYDKYIMTDSEEETEIPSHVDVAFAAEAAAIIAIGCVAGLKGLSKMRKGKPSKVVDSHHSDSKALSSAWDPSDHGGEKGKQSRSSTAVDNPLLRGMTPEQFASHEERENQDWDTTDKKSKKKKKESDVKEKETKKKVDPSEPQSELLTAELQSRAFSSVSKSFGEKILIDSLGARHSSMLNIASCGVGSRMSLNVSSDGEDDDDDFGEAISMVTGAHRKPVMINQMSTDKDNSLSTSVNETSLYKKETKGKGDKKKDKKNKKKDSDTEGQDVQKTKKGKKEQKGKENKEKEKSKSKKDKKGKNSKHAVAAIEVNPPVIQNSPPPAQAASSKDSKTSELTNIPTKEIGSKVSSTSTKNKKKEPPPPKESVQQVENKEVRGTQSAPSKEAQSKLDEISSRTSAAMGSGPREVENRVSMFDTESESEDDTKLNKHPSIGGKVLSQDSKMRRPQDISQRPKAPKQNENFIEADEQSLDIFGADGLAELNEALWELDNIHSTFDKDSAAGNRPNETTSASVSEVNKTRTATQGSKGVSKVEKGGDVKTYSWVEPVSGGSSVASGGIGELKFSSSEASRVDTQKSPRGSESTHSAHTRSHKSKQSVEMSTATTAAIDTSDAAKTSTGVQGTGYSTPFEQNVLGILLGLTETMQQMKANPSVSQKEINQQEVFQQQMIQNLISYSENDPELTKKLLALLKREQMTTDDATSTRSGFEVLEQRLLQAQELQLKKASEQFRTQEQFQQAIEKTFEEQAEQQAKLIQSNFERYSQLVAENAETKRQSKDKSHKKRRNHHKRKYTEEVSSSDSSSNESDDDGFVRPMEQSVAPKPAVKTMQAKIYHQDLLEEEAMRTSSQSSLSGMLLEKQRSRGALKRQDTSLMFNHTRDALKRFEASAVPVEEENEEESEEDEMLLPQHVRAATLKRADIMKQKGSNFVPNEKETEPVRKTSVVTFDGDHQQAQMKQLGPKRSGQGQLREKKMSLFDERALKYGKHVETNEHKKNPQLGDTTTAGAGGELAAALKLRQRQIGLK